MHLILPYARSQRHRRLLLVLAAAVAATLSGCAIVGSRVPDAQTPPSGMLYHLPKAVLPVQLVDSGGALELRLQPAQQVADPAQRYLLQHPVNAFSSDNVKVELSADGLLSKLTLDSTDQTLAVLTQAVRTSAIGRVEAAATGEVVLASGDFDPDTGADNARLFSDLQAALARQVSHWEQPCQTKPTDTPERCALVTRLKPRLSAANLLQITAQPLVAASGAAANSSLAPPDCSLGICYRSLMPYRLRLAVDGEFSRSTVVMLPNGAPPIALPLERAAFVKTEHTVEFNDNGSIKSVDTKRPSSALALVSWPMDVYKAFMEATGELIQLRIAYNSNAQNLAQSELDKAKELKRIADEMEALRNAKGSQKELSGGAVPSLLSITMGERTLPLIVPATTPKSSSEQPVPACGAPGQPCAGSDTKAKP